MFGHTPSDIVPNVEVGAKGWVIDLVDVSFHVESANDETRPDIFEEDFDPEVLGGAESFRMIAWVSFQLSMRGLVWS
jgi:hypothetical protein